jgi:phosphate starvation-inducible PhoH-like protein
MSKKRKKDKFVQHLVLHPLNDRQAQLINAIKDNQMTIICGYAGTGKTYVATMMAAIALLNGSVDKIYLTRPNVDSGRSLGFKPGTMLEKMAQWFSEVYSILGDAIGRSHLEYCLRKEVIEVVPFESMRGRSFRDGIVLLDEAQNTTPKEMKMFVTRIGDAKVILNGDIRQSDLSSKSGLKTAIDMVRHYEMDIPIIEFEVDDIVRSELCKNWIINWMDWESRA